MGSDSLVSFFSTLGLNLKKLFLPPKEGITERARHLDQTIDYYNYHAKSQPGFHIDSRTWADLDMDQLFLSLDHTLTAPGEQVLYALLRRASGLVFDFKLLEGPSERTNAIDVLQYVGYPNEIIQEANRIIGEKTS